jgi:(1->4)-alpha-D-glucan 1-alpha-D-glucosylmutase
MVLDGTWRESTVELPPGAWTDVLSGREVAGGRDRLGDVLAVLPVALLVRSA